MSIDKAEAAATPNRDIKDLNLIIPVNGITPAGYCFCKPESSFHKLYDERKTAEFMLHMASPLCNQYENF